MGVRLYLGGARPYHVSYEGQNTHFWLVCCCLSKSVSYEEDQKITLQKGALDIIALGNRIILPAFPGFHLAALDQRLSSFSEPHSAYAGAAFLASNSALVMIPCRFVQCLCAAGSLKRCMRRMISSFEVWVFRLEKV